MAGIGHFGRVPEDVERWRELHPWIMAWLGRRWLREEINTYQYITASLLRAARCLTQPQRAPSVLICQNGYCRQFHLFAGLLVNEDVFLSPSRIRFSVAGLINYVTGVLPREVTAKGAAYDLYN